MPPEKGSGTTATQTEATVAKDAVALAGIPVADDAVTAGEAAVLDDALPAQSAGKMSHREVVQALSRSACSSPAR